jgi:hypothetical protein
MYDFIVLTPTYNRSTELKKVATQIRNESVKSSVTVMHCILDDGSDTTEHNYTDMLQSLQTKKYRIKYKRHGHNLGRDKFWKTWDNLIKIAKGEKWRYCIGIPDDHILCKRFLSRVSLAFEIAKKVDKISIAMNILVKSRKNWNMNRFIDGAFICDRQLFECLEWTLAPINSAWFEQTKSKNFKIHPPSSGVWKQVSQRVSRNQSWRIATVKDISYLKPMDCPSAMFPESKFPKRPRVWGLDNFVDGKE